VNSPNRDLERTRGGESGRVRRAICLVLSCPVPDSARPNPSGRAIFRGGAAYQPRKGGAKNRRDGPAHSTG
jgi:hypothetical protein